jgi:hypothetical protein
MSKIELTRRWWNGVRPKDLKSPELDRSLASVEGAEGEDLVAALATVPGAIAKVTRGLDNKTQKDLLKNLEGLRLLAEQESKKAAAGARAKADTKSADQDEATPEDKLFDTTFVGANIRRALRGPVNFGFALGTKPEECALTVHPRGNPKSLMRSAKTYSGLMKACCGQAQADKDDPRTLILDLAGPPVSGVARMLRKHLRTQGITLFTKVRVLVDGTETESEGGDEEEPTEPGVETAPAGPELDQAQIDWQERQPDFEMAVQQVEELETASHPKAVPLRKLVDGIDNAAQSGRFAQASTTLDQFLPKLKIIYDEFQQNQPASEKSGGQPADEPSDSEASLEGEPAKVGKNNAAQKQAEQDYNQCWARIQPKLDDALVTARRFDSIKRARQDIVKVNDKVDAAVSAKDFVKALKLAKELEPKLDDYLKKAAAEDAKYEKKGQDISKQLDAATVDKRGDVAKTVSNSLTDDEIQHLPTKVRNRLLEEMQKDGWTDDKKAAAKKLYSQKYLDPEFEKIDKANRKKMIEKMKADPDFKKARDNWKKLSTKERVAIMKKAIDYQADAYGISKTTITTYSKADAKDFGFYRHKDGMLHVNENDLALKDGGFDEAIDTAVHENAHRYQAELIDKLEAGKIKQGDPLYDQAMSFKLNDTKRGFYVQPPEKTPSANTGDEYFTQPQENHSRITGAAVQRAQLGR